MGSCVWKFVPTLLIEVFDIVEDTAAQKIWILARLGKTEPRNGELCMESVKIRSHFVD